MIARTRKVGRYWRANLWVPTQEALDSGQDLRNRRWLTEMREAAIRLGYVDRVRNQAWELEAGIYRVLWVCDHQHRTSRDAHMCAEFMKDDLRDAE